MALNFIAKSPTWETTRTRWVPPHPPPPHSTPTPHPLPTTWVSFVFRNHRVNIYRAVKGGWILLTRVVGIHCRADGTYSRVSFQEERVFYTLILDFHGDITKTVRWYCILKQWLSPHNWSERWYIVLAGHLNVPHYQLYQVFSAYTGRKLYRGGPL